MDTVKVPLDAAHRRLGAKMVPFAGYDMPLQYEGIIAEHNYCRDKASLFDVSHMGQAWLIGDNPAKILEEIVPSAVLELKEGKQRYTVLTNDKGGIIDDLMIGNYGDKLFLVVNAACKEKDFAHIREKLKGRCELKELPERALLALQGKAAGKVMAKIAPDSVNMAFMDVRKLKVGKLDCLVSRSGYTGEDGFEISVLSSEVEALFNLILEQEDVKPAGLGARDTLRMEAGLCLYGSDINTETTPVEAGIEWVIGKRRRAEAGFLGDSIILKQLADGASKRLVGIRPEGKMPARSHTKIANDQGEAIGEITSGGFSPTLNAPVAMGYVKKEFSTNGSKVLLEVRGNMIKAEVVAMPFVPHCYKK